MQMLKRANWGSVILMYALLLSYLVPAQGGVTYDVPVADDLAIICDVRAAQAIKLSAVDPDGTAVTYALLTQPTKGIISNFNANTGILTYTPKAPAQSGTDSFTYRATSNSEDSAAATVTITFAQKKTRIRDRLVGRSGTITFVLTQRATSIDGLIPVSSSVSATLDDAGYFQADLYPSASLSPASYYQAWFYPTGGAQPELIGVYSIPVSSAVTTLAPNQVTNTNLAAQYVFPSNAALQSVLNQLAVVQTGVSQYGNLRGFNYEDLPVCNSDSDGKLMRVRNRNRDVYKCNGTAGVWVSQNGGQYNVMDFGACPTCSASVNATAMNLAIATAAAAGGGKVIGCGSYPYSATLSLKGGVTLEGMCGTGSYAGVAGTPAGSNSTGFTLKYTGSGWAMESSSGSGYSDPSLNITNVYLKNLTLDLTAGTFSGGVHWNNICFGAIEDVSFTLPSAYYSGIKKYLVKAENVSYFNAFRRMFAYSQAGGNYGYAFLAAANSNKVEGGNCNACLDMWEVDGVNDASFDDFGGDGVQKNVYRINNSSAIRIRGGRAESYAKTPTSVVRSSNVITVQFATAHNLQVGTQVRTYTPFTSSTNFSQGVITAVTSTTLTFASIGADVIADVTSALLEFGQVGEITGTSMDVVFDHPHASGVAKYYTDNSTGTNPNTRYANHYTIKSGGDNYAVDVRTGESYLAVGVPNSYNAETTRSHTFQVHHDAINTIFKGLAGHKIQVEDESGATGELRSMPNGDFWVASSRVGKKLQLYSLSSIEVNQDINTNTVFTAKYRANFRNPTESQASFSGYNSVTGVSHAENGEFQLGPGGRYRVALDGFTGRIYYDWMSDIAGFKHVFRTRTNGTPLTALDLTDGFAALGESGTATATAGAATANKQRSVITTESLTTAAGDSYMLTLTNDKITASSFVVASFTNGTNTAGMVVQGEVTPGVGSVTIVLRNIHASQPLNGTLKITVVVL